MQPDWPPAAAGQDVVQGGGRDAPTAQLRQHGEVEHPNPLGGPRGEQATSGHPGLLDDLVDRAIEAGLVTDALGVDLLVDQDIEPSRRQGNEAQVGAGRDEDAADEGRIARQHRSQPDRRGHLVEGHRPTGLDLLTTMVADREEMTEPVVRKARKEPVEGVETR